MTQRAASRLGLSLALMLAAPAAFAQEGARDINPAEQLMADILIGMAEVELKLNEAAASPLAAAPDGGDVIDRAKDRVTLLASTDLPKPQVTDPPVKVDPEAGEEVVAAKPVPQPVAPVDAAVPGINATAVSLDGQSIRSLLKSELSEAEKSALPDHKDCKDLGTWFLGLNLQRDLLTFFVRENDFVRVCSRLGNAWRVRTAGGQTRAHLVTVIN
ncbi:hypothetical protein [Antarctobacter jejuensis]|uniref:hypothetical protein n=1 Tax=Antarctobacter jejuensis TaxID=1439938 RepID=UPI003FCF472F